MTVIAIATLPVPKPSYALPALVLLAAALAAPRPPHDVDAAWAGAVVAFDAAAASRATAGRS